MNDVVNILAIETSCDDTAAALIVQNNKVLSNGSIQSKDT